MQLREGETVSHLMSIKQGHQTHYQTFLFLVLLAWTSFWIATMPHSVHDQIPSEEQVKQSKGDGTAAE